MTPSLTMRQTRTRRVGIPRKLHEECKKTKHGGNCACYMAGYHLGYRQGRKLGVLAYEEVLRQVKSFHSKA